MPRPPKRPCRDIAVWTALSLSLFVLVPASQHEGVRHIGTRVEPFVDDWLMARMDNLRLVLHRPVEMVLIARQSMVGENFGVVETDFLGALREAKLIG